MKNYLNKLVANSAEIQESCTEVRERFLERIKSGDMTIQSRVTEDVSDFLVFFASGLNFHRYDAKDDVNVRSFQDAYYRASAAVKIYLGKAYAAKKISEHFGKLITPESIQFNNEDELIDAFAEQIDSLVFGDNHHRLPTDSEYLAQYPNDDAPAWNGCYVKMGFVLSIYADGEIEYTPFCTAGKWVVKSGSDQMFPEDHFSTLKPPTN